MADTDKSFLGLINRSGFPLQIALAHEVKKRWGGYARAWDILSEEHYWLRVDLQTSGYIDLIAGNVNNRLVVECKRESEERWIFLNPGKSSVMQRAKFYTATRNINQCGWREYSLAPLAYESKYCVKATKGRVSLEETCRDLIQAVEALPSQEYNQARKGLGTYIPHTLIYAPVIVTTAALQVAHFAPEDIELNTGMISQGNCEDVPYLRFRKNLAVIPPESSSSTLRDINLAGERTVLVVNAASFISFLEKWELKADPSMIT